MKKAKRESWKEFRSKIGRSTPINNVWGMIKKKMRGIGRVAVPNIKSWRENSNNKAEIMVKTFAEIHSSDNLTEKEARERRN